MKKPARIIPSLTTQMREMYDTMLFAGTAPAGVTVYVVNQRRGKARHSSRTITVPAWALVRPKGEGYAAYYLAHELAHIADRDAGTRGQPHGPGFMTQFKRLCPPQYQHFEVGYKPRRAGAAGIQGKVL